MKRGFFNKSRPQATTRKHVKPQKVISGDKGSTNIDNTILSDLQIVAFDHSYFSEILHQPICTARTQAPSLKTEIHPGSLICTRVPSTSTDKYGTTACVLYAQPVPYEIRDTQSKGKAMFAKRALKTRDLILVERPLMVLPINTELSAVSDCPEILRETTRKAKLNGTLCSVVGILEPMLEVAFARMSKEDQKSFMELANAHKSDGTPKLSAIWRTNVYGFRELGDENYRYGAVLNEMSRINHSCRSNCANSFHKESFSFELRATKYIGAGEEIFYSYCKVAAPTAERQERLRLYGFICSCISCSPTSTHPASDAIRTSAISRLKALYERYRKFDRAIRGPKDVDRKCALTMYDENVSIMQDMRQEGVDGHEWYREALELHTLLLTTLVSLSQSTSEHNRWLDMAHRCYDSQRKLNLALHGSKDELVVSDRNEGQSY